MPRPAADELEISVFGPGPGECIVVHLGSGKWIVIDSCKDIDRQPIALNYFKSLGVNPSTDVPLVVVTHWHNDHIEGMAAVVEACASAQVAIPAALLDNEFGAIISAFEDAELGSFDDGVSEIRQVLYRIAAEKRVKFAIEERTLWSENAGVLEHKLPAEVRALSPADGQVSAMLKRLAQLMPKHATTMFRIPSSGKNDLSTAAWVTVGATAALLGADVETTTDPKLGWDAILTARGAVSSKATVFKVPHHGSANGHHGRVWTDLLEKDAICLVTPWTLGGGLLPKHSDIIRLLSHSKHVFVSSAGTLFKAQKKRDPAVERTLRENSYNLQSFDGKMGHIRLRAKPGEPWNVELLGAALQME